MGSLIRAGALPCQMDAAPLQLGHKDGHEFWIKLAAGLLLQNADAALQAHRLLVAAVVGARHHEALQAEQILRLQGPVFLFAAALCPGDAQKHNRPELEQVGGLHFRLPAHLGKALALTASFTAGRNLMSMASFSASGNRPVA